MQYCPGGKLATALVAIGPQGVGKSMLFSKYGEVFGRHATTVTNAELTGRFNGWLANKQFIVGEEITGGHGRNFADKLKHLITGPTVQWDEKNLPVREIPNLANFAFLSNRPDALHLDGGMFGDRRYAVSKTEAKLLGKAFFDAVSATDAGALFSHLLKVNLAKFNPYGHAPMTRAKAEMVDASLSQMELWVRDLKECPDAVTIDAEADMNCRRVHSLHTSDELLKMFGARAKNFGLPSLTKALREAGLKQWSRDGDGGDPSNVKLSEGHLIRPWVVRDADRVSAMNHGEIVRLYKEERGPGKKRKFAGRGEAISMRETRDGR